MKTVQFGNTGVEVSTLCLGTDHYGSRTDPERAFQLLDLYCEAGGAFIDTANVFTAWIPGIEGGESETTTGLGTSPTDLSFTVGGNYDDH